MFFGARLDAASINNILNVMLPQASYSGQYIHITLSNDGCAELIRILNPQESGSIPVCNRNDEYTSTIFTWKNWNMAITASDTPYNYSSGSGGGDGYDNIAGQYDVTEANGYIPDASSWNANCYTALTNAGLKITSVENGIAYQE